MARREPPQLTDPYATGSAPPPAPAAERPSAPERDAEVVVPPPARMPSLPSQPDLRSSAASIGTPLPTVLGEPMPTTAVVEPRPRRRWGKLVAGALAVVAVTAGAAAGGWLWYRSRPAPVLPVDIKSLPESTVAVSRDEDGFWILSLSGKDLPPEARWASLAEQLCGGTDVFRLLMRPSWRFAKLRLADAFAERRQISAALACGREMAKHVRETAVYRVTVLVPDEKEVRPKREKPGAREASLPPRTAELRLQRIDLDTLPDTSRQFKEVRDRGGLSGTRCLAVDDSARRPDCQDHSHAAARLDQTGFWLSGPYSGVSLFGRDFSPRASNRIEGADEWAHVAESLRPHAYASLGTADAFDDGFVFHTGFGYSPRLDEGLPSVMARLAETVRKYDARWSLADDVGLEGGTLRLELYAASESDAIDLLLDFREWHAGFKTHVAKAEEGAALVTDEDLRRTERDFYEVLHETGKRALVDATIERESKRVIFLSTVAYSDDAKQTIEAMREIAAARAATAAKIVLALAEGDKPEEGLMREIGGSDFVDILRDPEKARRDLGRDPERLRE